MESIHPEQIERINKFLLLKKQTGLPTEKIQIYLNLLSFFISHIEKKGLKIETLPNPDKYVLELQFEGLTPETEKEYLSLFMDFSKYCADNPITAQKQQAEDQDKLNNSHPAQPNSQAKMSKTTNCPKCGYLQKQSEKCSQCGSALLDKSKELPKPRMKGISLPKKKNRFYLLIILFLVSLFFAWYFKIFNMDKAEEFYYEGHTYTTDTVIDNTSLEYYTMIMEEYSSGMQDLLTKWNKIQHTETAWHSDHEEIFVKLKYLLSKIKKIEPVEPVKPLHDKLKSTTENIFKELKEVKSFFNSGSAVIKGGQRQGRLYNNSIIYFRELSETLSIFNRVMNSLCRYNGLKCNF